MKVKFDISGMTCAACSARVEKVASNISGVSDAQVNLMGGTMVAEVADEKVIPAIIDAITKAGYGAKKNGDKVFIASNEVIGSRNRLVASAVFLIILMYFSMGHMLGFPLPHWYCGTQNALVAALLQFCLALPVVFLNSGYYTRGFKSLFHGAPNMDTLIAVGSGASLCYGVIALFMMAYAMGHHNWNTVIFYRENLYFESAAMILTLISFGKFLEARAKGKTGDAVRALMNLRPETATVLRNGQECLISAADVQVGDTVLVRSGGRIPVDGVVIQGRGAVDQSALTGESIPVEMQEGMSVAAATILAEGYLQLRATKVGQDTTLHQIIRLVEEAGGSKAPIARLSDKIAGVFVPVVMGIAAVTFGIWMLAGHGFEFAFTSAISVLVISCPCALGLATPVSIMVGTGKGASLGILFKNGAALEQLHRIDTVVLDKTGTITAGKPSVTDVFPVDRTQEELLYIAASLEARSEHPVAMAICRAYAGNKVAEVQDFQTLPGRGVAGTIDGTPYIGGNRKLMQEHNVIVPEFPQMTSQGKTPLYFAANDTYFGAILVADVPKEDSRVAIDTLKEIGLNPVMLTGDNSATAAAIAESMGIHRVISDVLPTDKAAAIKQLQAEGHRVLMVGDGINDAPALVTADAGMAIGAGTDIAMESADVVLMSGSLVGIANAIRLSKATIRNIRQNLFWAFFYNCLGIPIAAGALFIPFGIQLSPMIGAAAMSMSSVFVVTNALRLRRFRSDKHPTKQKEIKNMTTVLKVEGMMCTHCKAMVEKVCMTVSGAESAVVDLQAKTVTVTGSASADALTKEITDAGYQVIG